MRSRTLPFVTEEAGNEGVNEKKIYFVGNVMIDRLPKNLLKLESGVPAAPLKSFLHDGKGRYAVLTLHRPSSNVDAKEGPLQVWSAIRGVAVEVPMKSRSSQNEEPDRGTQPRYVQYLYGGTFGISHMLHAVRGATRSLDHSAACRRSPTALGVPCVTIRKTRKALHCRQNQLPGRYGSRLHSRRCRIFLSGIQKGHNPPDGTPRKGSRISSCGK